MSKFKKIKNGVVYSTNLNFQYETNEDQINFIDPKNQKLTIHIEKKNRNGKTATLIKGFIGSKEDLKNLCKLLQKKCSSGGTVKNNSIIIQGNLREKIIEILEKENYSCKKVGG